jgi:hypothetical protein
MMNASTGSEVAAVAGIADRDEVDGETIRPGAERICMGGPRAKQGNGGQ